MIKFSKTIGRLFISGRRRVLRNSSLKRYIKCAKTLRPPLIERCRMRGWDPTKFIYILGFFRGSNRNSMESRGSGSWVLVCCLGAHLRNEGIIEVHESIEHPVLRIEEVVVSRLVIGTTQPALATAEA